MVTNIKSIQRSAGVFVSQIVAAIFTRAWVAVACCSVFLQVPAAVYAAELATGATSAPAAPLHTGSAFDALRSSLPTLAGTIKGRDPAQAAVLLQSADSLRTFAVEHESTPAARLAAVLEAQYLIRAAEAGDWTQEARLRELVATVRADKAIPEHSRFLIASLVNRLPIQQDRNLNRAARLGAYERSAREMIHAFPSEPSPYWALVALARDAVDESSGVALAREVAAMSAAPAVARNQAAKIVARSELLGKPLNASFKDPDGTEHELGEFKGAPVAIYTWMSSSAGSIALAKELSRLARPDTVIIGIGLDRDFKIGAATATEKKLPGRVVYALNGADALTQALHVAGSGYVYLVGRDGKVQSVRAQHGLASSLAAVETANQGAQ